VKFMPQIEKPPGLPCGLRHFIRRMGGQQGKPT
jgi:hypothetical protein